MDTKNLLAELSKPFPPSAISWKPGSTTKDGAKCMALAYADLRAYQDRLDEVMGIDWSCQYVPWEGNRIICELTIYVGDSMGRREAIMRSSTGEADAQDEKNNMAGSVSEAMAFKRAAAMFGLGRYLYDLPNAWVEFDSQYKRISDKGKAELESRYQAWYARTIAQDAQQAPQRTQGTPASKPTRNAPTTAQRPSTPATGKPAPVTADQLEELNALGEVFYGDKWETQQVKLVEAVTKGAVSEVENLLAIDAQKLIEGIQKKMAPVNLDNVEPVAH